MFNHTITREELKPGDHIYSWRMELYTHHGIYMGDGIVIHFRGAAGGGGGKWANSSYYVPPPPDCKKCREYREKMVGDPQKEVDGVAVSCLDCFLAGGRLERYGYSVSIYELGVSRSMTCTSFPCDPPERVLERANALLKNGFGQYNLLLHNCEDLAFYCKTGNNYPPKILINAAFAYSSRAAIGPAVIVGSAAAYGFNWLKNKLKK